MNLHRLTINNWRGVSRREILFDSKVTLIEGPNEIGKSTLIEALLTLLEELDSSNKKTVKAVQPVGEDCGSEVEAEISCGDYRFSYRKSFNRNRSTSLKISSPRPP